MSRREFVSISAESPSSQETKVSVNSTTGAVSWVSGDEVAYCVTDGSTTRYDTATIDLESGGFYADLESGYSRTGYCIYPASCAGGDATTPTVTFPASYDMGGACENPAPPVPMIAINSGTSVSFYHVGGLVRLRLTELDADCRKIRITGNNIAGTYSVSNAGTTSSAATGTGTTNYIEFTGIPSYKPSSEVVLWIPLPPNRAITKVEMYNGSNTVIGSRTIYKIVNRAHAISYTYDKEYTISLTGYGTQKIDIGKTQQLGATVKADGKAVSSPSLTWSSTDTSVGTVSSSGLVTMTNKNKGVDADPLKTRIDVSYTPPGKAAIKDYKWFSATHVYSLTVYPTSRAINVGADYHFGAYGTVDGVMGDDLYTSGKYHDVTISWAVSATKARPNMSTTIASSQGLGIVKGLKAGTAYVWCTTSSTTCAPATVTVVN